MASNLFNLSDQNSVANQFITELRDKKTQKNRLRFRKNIERLGQIMAYEISKMLTYKASTVETPLATADVELVDRKPVLIAVMRAGLPYFEGFLDFFDQSDCGFIGAYRTEGGAEIEVNLDYIATPFVGGCDVILIDPMLATGKSFMRSVEAVLKRGTPAHIYIAALIATPEGISYLQEHVKHPHSIWTCAIDEKLNDQFYIVPGLGDAGDLSFGPRV